MASIVVSPVVMSPIFVAVVPVLVAIVPGFVVDVAMARLVAIVMPRCPVRATGVMDVGIVVALIAVPVVLRHVSDTMGSVTIEDDVNETMRQRSAQLRLESVPELIGGLG